MTLEQKRLARQAAWGQKVWHCRGRTDRAAYVTHNTPVVFAQDNNQEPKLVGAPYWKTGFSNGNFHKILYTPSTLKITVGKNWLENQKF